MPTRRLLVLVLALSTVAASACDRGPGRLSADEFWERTNAACTTANRAIGELGAVLFSDAARAAESVDDVTRIQRDLRDELGALRPPEEAQDTYDEWLGEIDAALAASDELAAALRAGDPAAQQAANEAGAAATARADTAAHALGATACAIDDAPRGDGGLPPSRVEP